MLSLRRIGTDSQSWDAIASFTLSRYAAVATNPNTRLDINLNGSDQSTTLAPVMTFFAPSTVGGLGRVGINNTNPQYNLDVTGAVRFYSSTSSASAPPDVTQGSQGLTLVCAKTGTSAYSMSLGVDNTGGYGYINAAGNSNYQNICLQTQSTTTGYVGIGTVSPDVKLHVVGTVKGTSFNATSDYRMKENVQPLSVNKTIDNLKPVEYDLSGGVHDMGFLAHEVQEEYPFLVQGEKDGDSMQSLNYNGFIALLVKEVQELKTNFRTLSLENEMLREKVKSLENKVEILGEK
jgi:hypothetical protein